MEAFIYTGGSVLVYNVIELMIPYLIAVLIAFIVIIFYLIFMMDIKVRILSRDLKAILTIMEKHTGIILSEESEKKDKKE